MPSVTDWIQTAAVLAGLGLAVNELFLRETLTEREKKQSTLHFIEQSGSSEVLGAVKKMIEYRRADAPTSVWTIVADVAPYTQFLEAISTCYDNELCSKPLTRKFVCEKLNAYEVAIAAILTTYANPISIELMKDRKLQQTVLWADCEQNET